MSRDGCPGPVPPSILTFSPREQARVSGLGEPRLPGAHSCGCWELSPVNLTTKPFSLEC